MISEDLSAVAVAVAAAVVIAAALISAVACAVFAAAPAAAVGTVSLPAVSFAGPARKFIIWLNELQL